MPAASNDSTSGSMKTMETRETQTHQTGMFESQNEIVQTFLFNSNSTQVRVQKIDAISLEPNAPPPVPHSNASQQQSTQAVYETSLIGDKILLLNQIDYSSLYRCVNVNSRKEFICKIVERCDRGNGMIWAHYQMADYSGINKLSEVLMNNRYLYLIFEKSFGDLLSYVRQKKRLQETEAKVLFKQISEIVKNCHKHNIVLRDLKLRKFVFADHQRTELKLESLEDSVTVENGTKGDLLQDKRGCPSYVSPEILKAGSSYSGRAADMWSLGVILYTMLVGKYPFSHSEHTSLFVKISRCNYSIPDSLSFQAKSLIRSLLKREPTQRLKSDEILSHPWLKGDEEVDDYDDEDEDDDGDGDDDGEYDDDDFEDNDDDYNDDDEGSDNNENEQAYTSKDDDSKTKYSKNYDHVVPESNNYKFA